MSPASAKDILGQNTPPRCVYACERHGNSLGAVGPEATVDSPSARVSALSPTKLEPCYVRIAR